LQVKECQLCFTCMNRYMCSDNVLIAYTSIDTWCGTKYVRELEDASRWSKSVLITQDVYTWRRTHRSVGGAVILDDHLVQGEGTGLIRAKHVHASHLLNSTVVTDKVRLKHAKNKCASVESSRVDHFGIQVKTCGLRAPLKSMPWTSRRAELASYLRRVTMAPLLER